MVLLALDYSFGCHIVLKFNLLFVENALIVLFLHSFYVDQVTLRD
jgi:hypothetical protein